MKKWIVSIGIIILSTVPIACTDDSISCGENSLGRYSSILSMDVVTGFYAQGSFRSSWSRNFLVAAVRVQIERFNYFNELAFHPFSFGLINQAFACSPLPPMPTQPLTSITITADAPVYSNGLEYKEGDTINELFYITNRDSSDVEGFIEAQNENLRLFGDYENSDLIFMLASRPDSSINHRFTFDIQFADSTEFILESPVFYVD